MGDFWKLTQQLLQGEEPLIKRPKLTDALLNKPPFRFLHDIISEVTRNTGFAEGLFTEEEQVSTNIKDKDGKVAYLTKILTCVGLALDETVSARPLKIVAGLEPENTNKFLQMLAQAATSGSPASQLAVQRVLAGEQMPAKSGAERTQRTSESRRGSEAQPPRQPEPIPTPPPAKEPVPRGPARPPSGQSEGRRSSTPAADSFRGGPTAQEIGERERPPSGVEIRVAPSGEPAATSSAPKKEPAAASNAPRVESVRGAPQTEAQRGDGRSRDADGRTGSADGRTGNADGRTGYADGRTGSADGRSGSAAPGARLGQSGAAINPQVAENENGPRQREPDKGPPVEPVAAPVASTPPVTAAVQRPGTASRGPMRPQSARRGPPKLPSNLVTPEKIPETKPGSVPPGTGPLDRAGSARKSGRDVTVPAATPAAAIIPDDAHEDDDDEGITIVESAPVSDDVSLPDGAGKLVRDILETRKDLEKLEEGALGRTVSINGRTDGAKREELQRLRGVVQSLCQSATPLGKSMEYLQEDLENMAKEFQHWNREKKTHGAKLEEERRLTQEALQAPLGQLADMDDEIKRKREALDTLKAQVWRNDETINGLLQLVMAGPSGNSR